MRAQFKFVCARESTILNCAPTRAVPHVQMGVVSHTHYMWFVCFLLVLIGLFSIGNKFKFHVHVPVVVRIFFTPLVTGLGKKSYWQTGLSEWAVRLISKLKMTVKSQLFNKFNETTAALDLEFPVLYSFKNSILIYKTCIL